MAEDLHWADPTTVDLLGLLATERIPGTMILITSRHPLSAPWASSVVDIALEPLEEKEAAGLVAALTDGGLDAAQRRLIVERGAGVPLFLQELTRSAVTAHPGEVLPPRIHEILTARLRAPGIDLRVAQLAATLGGEFDEEPLRQLAGRTVDDALVRLEDAALIERVAEVRLGRYRFRHGLLRDAAYETQLLPPASRPIAASRSCSGPRRNLARRSGRRGPTLGPGRRRRAVHPGLHRRRRRRRSRRPATPRPASCSTAPWSWRRRCPRATSAT